MSLQQNRRKTSVLLDHRDLLWLKMQAAERGVSMASIIRELIRQESKPKSTNLRLFLNDYTLIRDILHGDESL